MRIYCWRISNISNSVGRNDKFLAKARKLSILPTELDIFDGNSIYVFSTYTLIILFDHANLFYGKLPIEPHECSNFLQHTTYKGHINDRYNHILPDIYCIRIQKNGRHNMTGNTKVGERQRVY